MMDRLLGKSLKGKEKVEMSNPYQSYGAPQTTQPDESEMSTSFSMQNLEK